MRSISPLQRRTHPVALDCLDQDDRGTVFAIAGFTVSRVKLLRVLSATLNLRNLGIGQGIHQLFKPRVTVYPVFTLLIARQNRIALIVSVQALFHTMPQDALVVRSE